MTNLENDPRMPWNQRTWVDTFVPNKAFVKHNMSMMLAMNEIREEKRAAEQKVIDDAVQLANTYRHLIGKKGEH